MPHPALSRNTRGLTRAVAGVLLLAAAVTAAAWAIRLGLVEPPGFAWACQSAAPPWWCPLRQIAVDGLRFGALGFAALGCGLVAVLRGGRGAALAAIGLGAAGLVLYAPEPAAGGALLGAMALLRR
ncbi:MAG TPA: hypothetical protein VES39_08590 [Rhodospirillales bacterium]|nr:hypothetical protein [Rhodospirillales bacterium]